MMVKAITLIFTFIIVFLAGIYFINNNFNIAAAQTESSIDNKSTGFDRYVENFAFGPGENYILILDMDLLMPGRPQLRSPI